ncbi:unnamed protein product [Rhodiola kirilowii]
MGSKRSYDGQEPLQLPCKYSKQLATDERVVSFADERLAPVASMLPCIESNDKLHIPFEHNGHKAPRLTDPFECISIPETQNGVDKSLVDGLRFPWITDNLGDDDAWFEGCQRSISSDYFHSNSPRRAHVNIGNALSSFLNRYPRKQVPVGANYQADLAERKSPKPGGSSGFVLNSDQVLISNEEKQLMGTSVISMPDSSLPVQNSLTRRKDCECMDKASVRCVRQHVKEARDKLMKALGEVKFRALGFLDMGEVREEVAYQWSEEEEQVFHEVVFSNPASLGKDFWSCLSEEFPTRSLRDLVSYYFNVFMLRKRAAQNRYRFLDIDSDDDEWHPGHGGSFGIGTTGEDDDDSSDEHNDSNSGNYGEENTRSADYDEEESLQPNIRFFIKESNSLPINHDDSWISLEYQSGMKISFPTKTDVLTKDLTGLKSHDKHFSSDQTESGNGMNCGSTDDFSNFREWNQGFSASLDHLLPTQNMIEEIFGPGSWDNSPNND